MDSAQEDPEEESDCSETMMNRPTLLIAFALYPLGLCMSVCASLAQTVNLDGAKRLVQTISSRTQEIHDFVEASQYVEPTAGRIPLAMALARLNPKSDADEIVGLIINLVHYSLLIEDDHVREYIDHDVVIECLVEALHFPDKDVHEIALQYLSKYVPHNRLRGREEAMIAAWDNVTDYRLLILIGTLEIDKVRDFFATITAKDLKLSDGIKARLGNIEAEDRLVQKFLAEKDAKKKADLAHSLGYVRSDKTLIALASEMRNPTVVGDVYHSWSIRYRVLEAFAYAFPDEELFHGELREVVRRTSDPLKYPDAAEKIGEPYIDRVETWLRDKYNIDWRFPRPPFLLDQSERIRVRPIKQ